MKSNLEPLRKNNKKNEKKLELTKMQNLALLCQGIMIVATIIAFIMARFIPELSLVMYIYLVVLSFNMAYTNYAIYKAKASSLIYLVLGFLILVYTILGIVF